MQGVVSPAKESDGGRPNDALVIQMARLGLEMFGMGGVVSGTVKPYGTVKVLVQAGYNTTNSIVTINFPQAFPTTCIAVVATGNGVTSIYSQTKTGFVVNRECCWIALGY